MKKIKILIILMILSYVLYRINPIRIPISYFFLAKELKEYKKLNEIKSDRVKKIAIGSCDMREDFYYDSITNVFLIRSNQFKLYNYYDYWKIDKNGIIIDSIHNKTLVPDPNTHELASDSNQEIIDKGIAFDIRKRVQFYENHYVDWFLTGDKSKKRYYKTLNYDLLDENEIIELLDSATIIDLDENGEMGYIYLQIDSNWIQIKSASLVDKIDVDFQTMLTYFTYKGKDYSQNNNLTKLERYSTSDNTDLRTSEDKGLINYNWKNTNNILTINGFVKTSHVDYPWFSLNGSGGSGLFDLLHINGDWEGLGYWQLNYNEPLNFKTNGSIHSYFISPNSYGLDIQIGKPKNNTNFIFLKLTSENLGNIGELYPNIKEPYNTEKIYITSEELYIIKE